MVVVVVPPLGALFPVCVGVVFEGISGFPCSTGSLDDCDEDFMVSWS